MESSKKCIIYLVRHGESIANTQDTYGLDTELTQKGIEQTNRLVQTLSNISLDSVYSSPLIRARQTAEIIAKQHKLKVIIDKDLRERYYGILEGQIGSEMKKKYKNLYTQRSTLIFEKRLKFRFSANYENDEQVMDRFAKAILKIANNNSGKTVLVVSHSTAMKSILWYLNYVTHNEVEGKAFDNSGYIKVLYDGNKLHIDSIIGRKDSEI